MAVHRRARRKLEDIQREVDFVDRVASLLAEAGYKVSAAPRMGSSPAADLFVSKRKKRILVECKLEGFRREEDLVKWLRQTRQVMPPIQEAWLVGVSIPNRLRMIADPYPGVELWDFDDLRSHLQRQQHPVQSRNASSRKIGNAVKANSNQIVIATAALAALIDERLSSLKEQKPNSPEAIETRDTAILDYEALRAKVNDLQDAVAKFTKGKIKEVTIQKKALSFGEGVQSWWQKDHQKVLSTAYGTGVFLSAIGVCSLIGVNPDVAAATAAALIGGKSIGAALKGLPKSG